MPQITIDSADYSGYTSAQLEISLRVFQGNGQAFARVINDTDSAAILNSEVSTTSQTYTAFMSNKFQLSSGKKVYKIQLKTLTGYEASFQDARLKVNF